MKKLILIILILIPNFVLSFNKEEIKKIDNTLNKFTLLEEKILFLDKLQTKITNKNNLIYLDNLKLNLKIKDLRFNRLFLKENISQKLQEKPLSCESNSASIFASYILQKDILEDDIFLYISYPNTKKEIIWKNIFWWDPNKEFVWNIKWKQSSNIKKFTWYGVYATPIKNSLEKYKIKTKIVWVSKKEIVESLFLNKPIIFWYLLETSPWVINTKPIIWQTYDNKIIKWYIWQHTWLIVWVSFDKKQNISRVYFYEWKSKEIQVMNYGEFLYKTRFLNEMIIAK